MSTKTTFKRIALVTVAALGFGVMSVAPSMAVSNTYLQCTTADGGTPADTSVCNGVAGAFNYVTLTIDGAADSVVTSTTPMSSASVPANLAIVSGGLSAEHNGTSSTFRVATPTAGTVTVQYWTRTGGILAAAAAETVTITVNASAQSGVASATKSVSYLVAGESTTAITDVASAADATVKASGTYNATAKATIKVKLLDALGVADNDSLTATIASATGAGSISNTTTPTANSTATTATTNNSGLHFFYVHSNGIAGVAVITIKAGTTTISTETVTFVGLASKYVAAVGGATYTGSNFAVGANASALKVTATDTAGNAVVDGTDIYAFSGTAATATVTTSAQTVSGVATFDLTGLAAGSSVITFGNASTAATSTVTTTSTVAVTKSTAKTVTLTLDKDTYEPGEKMVLTITATDADGKGVADGARAVVAGIASNFGLTNASTLSNTTVLLGGKVTQTIYAPATSGKFTITATEGAATDSTTKAELTVSATIVNAALVASQEATDAATEAGDNANNAKDAADQAIEAADLATIAAQEAGELAVAAAEAAGEIASEAKAAAEDAKEAAQAATTAVAALSTEVAKLMADLNLRITKLGNKLASILKAISK